MFMFYLSPINNLSLSHSLQQLIEKKKKNYQYHLMNNRYKKQPHTYHLTKTYTHKTTQKITQKHLPSYYTQK